MKKNVKFGTLKNVACVEPHIFQILFPKYHRAHRVKSSTPKIGTIIMLWIYLIVLFYMTIFFCLYFHSSDKYNKQILGNSKSFVNHFLYLVFFVSLHDTSIPKYCGGTFQTTTQKKETQNYDQLSFICWTISQDLSFSIVSLFSITITSNGFL